MSKLPSKLVATEEGTKHEERTGQGSQAHSWSGIVLDMLLE